MNDAQQCEAVRMEKRSEVRSIVRHGCIVVVQTSGFMSDETFDCNVLRPLTEQTLTRFLFWGIGDPTLTPKQRAGLTSVVKAQQTRVAALTDSALARGVVTALSWAYPQFAAFKPQQFERAMTHLLITAGPAAELKTTAHRLMREVLPAVGN